MNMQVNLILDSEKRSGSSVSLKFVVRVAAVAIPVLAGILIAALVMLGRSARQNLRFAEQDESQKQSVYQSVLALDQQSKEYRQVADVLKGWADSRVDWALVLDHFQDAVPTSIQLLRMTINERIGLVNNVPARISGMYIKGKVTGDRAEDAVQELDKSLRGKPVFANVFAKVDVKRFEASEDVADKNTRVFEIECILTPRKIGKPKVKRRGVP